MVCACHRFNKKTSYIFPVHGIQNVQTEVVCVVRVTFDPHKPHTKFL